MKSSEYKDENLRVSLEYISEAARRKADIVCFPEFQMAYSPADQSLDKLSTVAESVKKGQFVSSICKSAKQNKLTVVATIYEKNAAKSPDRRVFDTAILIDSKGTVRSIYRKLHLYDALGFKESNKFAPGDIIEKPSRIRAGSLGLLICYDLRFPEMSRILAVNGADILVAPSAWVQGVMKEEHWQTMVKARAIENGSFVVAPDQVGNIYSGRSMVVDPYGAILLDMGNREGMEIVEIDSTQVQKVRESLPLLKTRRIDVYGKNINAFS